MEASAHMSELAGQRRMSQALSSIPGVSKDKPKVDISLEDQQAGAFVPSYTTLDRIKGTATIKCPSDTTYDSIHVIFQGAARTYVEKIGTTAPTIPRTNAYHNFLRLVQPMDDIEMPHDRTLRAGETYSIPFLFVVPEKLLPAACTHAKDTPTVHEHHLSLPPSMGDPMMASDGRTLLDDLAPPMTIISYGIRVIIVKRESTGAASPAKPRALADAMKKLRIVPKTEEAPPLSIEDGVDDYYLCRRKSMKKGMFKGKLGTLLASASQPSPLRLPFIRTSEDDCPNSSTVATIDLTFLPGIENAKPPKLNNCFVKLKAGTFYATTPLSTLPTKASSFAFDLTRGFLVDTVHLSSRRLGSVPWKTHNEKSPDPAAVLDTYYTARVVVPIDLPKSDKTYVPSFHTCLVSRIYSLDIALAAKASLGSSATLHLKVPLQIIQEGNPNPEPLISPSEAAAIRQREEAVNEMMRRGSQAAASPGRNSSVSVSPRNNSVISGGRNNSVTGGAMHARFVPGSDEDASSGMADLTLRGARGSVFAPHRWGSVDGRAHPEAVPEEPNGTNANGLGIEGANGLSSEPEDLEDEPETRAAIAAALAEDADDVQARETQRIRDRDDPPQYTAHNGIMSRPRTGSSMWT